MQHIAKWILWMWILLFVSVCVPNFVTISVLTVSGKVVIDIISGVPLEAQLISILEEGMAQ